jgi:hypothetical protein
MALPLHKSRRSSAQSRTGEWKEILDIVGSLGRLEINGTTKALVIDEKIGPNLPTSEECIRSLNARMRQPLSPSFAEVLQARVDKLRHRMLLGYNESISQMVSLSEFTVLDDLDVQQKHSRSVEIWFNQALEELFSIVMEYPEVRTIGVLIWYLIFDDLTSCA